MGDANISQPSTETIVRCPTCHKSQVWDSENEHRPFCSRRCKLIDLGAWADESHVIKGEPSEEALLEAMKQLDDEEQQGDY